MKKYFVLTMMVLAMATGSILAAQIESDNTDSLLAARQFAIDLERVAYYDIHGDINVRIDDVEDFDDSWREDDVDFRYIPGIGITRLSINDIDIVTDSDDPVQTIPMPTDGRVESVWFHAHGYDSDGNWVHYGSANLGDPRPGDPILIQLEAGWGPGFVPYNPPEGIDPITLSITIQGIGSQNYDQERGGFIVWYNRTAIDRDFSIYSSTTQIDGGELNQNGTVSVEDQLTEMFVGFELDAGVERVDVTGHPDTVLSGLTLDGQTKLDDGSVVPAKVISVKKNADSDVPFSVVGIKSVTLALYGIDSGGSLVLLEDSQEHLPVGYYDRGVSLTLTADDYNEVIIVILDVTTETLSFGLRFDSHGRG